MDSWGFKKTSFRVSELPSISTEVLGVTTEFREQGCSSKSGHVSWVIHIIGPPAVFTHKESACLNSAAASAPTPV